MEDKKKISNGVVYDLDGMQEVCHRLRAIDLSIEGLSSDLFTDGSKATEGLNFMLHDLIKWLAPGDAVHLSSVVSVCRASGCSCDDHNKLLDAIDLLDKLRDLLLSNKGPETLVVNLGNPTVTAAMTGMFDNIEGLLRRVAGCEGE